MNEFQWDKKLKIRTSGREDSHADDFHYPYEPTPYSVLHRLAASGYLTQNSVLVDYGCGRGRVGFFLHYFLGCSVTGIEYNKELYNQALKNRTLYVRHPGPDFLCANAEDFPVTDADCFYFFNPFSVKTLHRVLDRILTSYYRHPRPMYLFFYYPSNEYLSFLMTAAELTFLDEIDCQDLFEGKNKRERILIFEIA